ncbi:MAG TPA: hypothetical protein VLA16_03245 [Ideonella sp.]|nr:hypothetical protein [Ideonella sp.]
MRHPLSHPLRSLSVACLASWAALAAAPALAQADPPPSTQSNPAAAAVRTPVAPRSATQAPAAPMVVAKGEMPTAASRVSMAEARYQRERALCESGRSNQDRTTCLKEAGAALDEARRNALQNGDDAATRRANATERCKPLPDTERRECEARMVAGETAGTAQAGGIIRELKVTETKPAPEAASAPKP